MLERLISNPSELSQQTALFAWAAMPETQKTFPGIDLMFHVPNGGARSIATASNLKASGVKPGVPDIFLPVPMRPPYSQNLGYFGLFIEMKAADSKKAKPSKSQLEMMERLKDKGYACKVCYGFEQAKEAINDYYGMAH